jgi:fucose permease
MLGTLVGGFLLMRFNANTFLRFSTLLAILFVIALSFIQHQIMAWILVGLVSIGVSNIFPLIYSITVGNYSGRANEISGLMVMAISGGAIFPMVVAFAMEVNLNGGLWIILGLLLIILMLTSIKSKK